MDTLGYLLRGRIWNNSESHLGKTVVSEFSKRRSAGPSETVHLRPGDVLTVTRLDRLARSTTDLLHIAERLKEIGAGLRSLAEPWADTTSPAGRMILTIFAGIADFERSLIGERTSAGRAAARAKGVRFGPKPVLTVEQITHAQRVIDEGQSVAEVARLLGVHRATLYRALPKK